MYSIYVAVIICRCHQKGVTSDLVITEKAICSTEAWIKQKMIK